MATSLTTADTLPAPDSRSLPDRLRPQADAALAGCATWADSRWLFPAVLAATVAGLFFDAVGPDCVFAYRDSLHFYPPLYKLVREEWLSGRVPLWNPLLNCGQPLAAMGTAGAFYIPQLVLTAILPDGVSLIAFCIAHLALAATGSYCLARHQGCSRPAATVAGVAYGFCGSVFLQIYNPIYAAGAAWLAWAVYAGIRLLERGSLRDGLFLAAAVAMAVYCGDPQAAYHAGIVLGLVWLCMPARSWQRLGLVAAAGVAGGLLASVQIALTAEFMRSTSRGIHPVPHSIWEIPAFLARPVAERAGLHWYDVLFGRPPVGDSHYGEIYEFSVFPWRVLELVWADFSGTTFYRWPVMLGIDTPGPWANSLYAGVVPVAAAIAAVFAARGRWQPRYIWCAVLGWAALSSLGGLGIVGLVRNLAVIATGRWPEFGYHAGDEVGGLYWAMSILLPGYGGFRYPAKWMTVFALALSQLAGGGLTLLAEPVVRAGWGRAIAAIRNWAFLGLLVGLGAAAIVGVEGVLPGAAGDERRGLAWWAVMRGGVLAATVATVAGFVLLALSRCEGKGSVFQGASVAIALLAAIDLVVAGRGEIVVEPFSDLVASSGYLERLPTAQPQEDERRPSRLYVQGAIPKFVDQREPRRFVRYTGIMGRSHVPWLHGAGLVGEPSTAMPADLERLHEPRRIDGRPVPPRRVLDLAGAEYFVVSLEGLGKAAARAAFADWSLRQRQGEFEGPAPCGEPLPMQPLWLPGEEDDAPVALLVKNTAALPRARVVREVDVRPPGSPSADEIAIPSVQVPDLWNMVIVEAESDVAIAPPAVSGAGPLPTEDACRIVVDEPQRVVVEASLANPGMLVLADSFHPDWHAAVCLNDMGQQPVSIHRANLMHRAVSLPAGRHRVEFFHHSQTFTRSVALTLAAWAIWVAALAVSLRKPHDWQQRAA
jgi:hypothetical protein